MMYHFDYFVENVWSSLNIHFYINSLQHFIMLTHSLNDIPLKYIIFLRIKYQGNQKWWTENASKWRGSYFLWDWNALPKNGVRLQPNEQTINEVWDKDNSVTQVTRYGEDIMIWKTYERRRTLEMSGACVWLWVNPSYFCLLIAIRNI